LHGGLVVMAKMVYAGDVEAGERAVGGCPDRRGSSGRRSCE
jgi:hypothetical protein